MVGCVGHQIVLILFQLVNTIFRYKELVENLNYLKKLLGAREIYPNTLPRASFKHSEKAKQNMSEARKKYWAIKTGKGGNNIVRTDGLLQGPTIIPC